jgi:hypothetical protein
LTKFVASTECQPVELGPYGPTGEYNAIEHALWMMDHYMGSNAYLEYRASDRNAWAQLQPIFYEIQEISLVTRWIEHIFQ